MSIERFDGHAWVTCDGCERDSDPVEGDKREAEDRARRDGWRLASGGRYCPACIAKMSEARA